MLEQFNPLKTENQKQKDELIKTKKALLDTEDKLKKFMKGKESLDHMTEIKSNIQKKGLGHIGESSKKNKSKKTFSSNIYSTVMKPMTFVKAQGKRFQHAVSKHDKKHGKKFERNTAFHQ